MTGRRTAHSITIDGMRTSSLAIPARPVIVKIIFHHHLLHNINQKVRAPARVTTALFPAAAHRELKQIFGSRPFGSSSTGAALLLLLLLLLLGARSRGLYGLKAASAMVKQLRWCTLPLLSAAVVITHSDRRTSAWKSTGRAVIAQRVR
jgi:hypothetical protein